MKSIIYILIAVFISSIVVSALPVSFQKQVVSIQCVDEFSNPKLINESRLIIENRLKDYGLDSFEVLAKEDQKTIDISFKNDVNIKQILPLLLLKGKIEFYESNKKLDLNKSHISQVSITKADSSLLIIFNKSGAILWQDITKRNIGDSIAVVIDNEVYANPKVMEEIKEGKCKISGNFSLIELKLLRSLINNDPLPLDFKLRE